MINKYFILYLIFFSCSFKKTETNTINRSKKVIYSTIVKDSFDIEVFLPYNYDSSKKYNTVYFLDAGIKSGTHFNELLTNSKNVEIRNKAIFVGIGHIGNFNVLRRRDFLPPILKNHKLIIDKDKNYGHADLFYLFMQNELIPMLERDYKLTTNRSIIGHSFGGLFAYYCLFQDKPIFQNYFALSPSLWVNNNNIFEYEKKFHQNNTSNKAYLYMANGSLEFLNYVLTSNRKMEKLLKERNYDGLQLDYFEKQFANHNSHVALTLQEVLLKLNQLY